MADNSTPIIEYGDNSVFIDPHDQSYFYLWLRIGPTSPGKPRYAKLTAHQARILAYALLSEAERIDERKENLDFSEKIDAQVNVQLAASAND